MRRLPVVVGAAQLDLILNVQESGGLLSLALEHNLDVIAPSRAQWLLDHLLAVLTAVVADRDLSMDALASLLAERDLERRRQGAAKLQNAFQGRLAERRAQRALAGQ
jgi:hypothetical protein